MSYHARICEVCGEPFNRSFDDVARMTDYQIIELLIKPAARRQEDSARRSKGLPPLAPPDAGEPDFKPDKTMMVSVLMGLGMSKEQALAEYAAQEKMNAEKAR